MSPASPRLRGTALILLAVALGVASCQRAPVTAQATLSGEGIFRQKCADCHGARGEGVEGKYAGALTGDWSLERLTRYTAANMPDDAPETLTPAEAHAVSAYVFDAFYSPAAQARLHPARIELSHLTNLQYLTTVADLVGQFSRAVAEPPSDATEAEGLAATYYGAAQRGRFDASKVVHRGVDPIINFEFTPGSPAQERVGAKEFSMQWRGSVLADETGDYEFVVRTPNTMRFWINADPRAAADVSLDVNVSNPSQPDHRVTVRLLGGRRYPIGIDYWALPEKEGAAAPAIALRWKPPRSAERPIPARNLSPRLANPTLVIGTRFPPDDSSHGYERGLSVSKEWDDATTRAAFEVANHVAKRIDRLAGTRAGEAGRAAKIEAFAARWVGAAFRRPLAEGERELHVASVFRESADPDIAMRRVLLRSLKSPHFLYPDLPASEQPAHRVATRLALNLWDSLPDEGLRRSAAGVALASREAVRAEATRMLGDPRARAKLHGFFQQWLQLRFEDDLGKEPTLFPGFSPELADDLRTSLNLFLDEVAWSEASDFRELLRADYLIANGRIARFYGLPVPPGEGFARVPAPGGERSGVMTHPYVLAALSYPKSTSPIHRGVFLTRSIVGRSLRSPPVAVAFNDEEFTPDMTMRQKVEKLTRAENCQGCHAVINPLGFSLEWYDAAGRFRREELGRPVNAASDYVIDDGSAVKLAGARDVAEFAISNPRSVEAFIEQLFHHLVKQPAVAYGPDTLPRLRESFVASGHHLRKLLVEIATFAALHGAEPALPVASLSPPSP
jgi:mono/diheme cytochrome c family protein